MNSRAITLSRNMLSERIRTCLVVAAVSFMAAGSAPAANTFPPYPLLTGGDSVPPNIMLILDDSGSMAFKRMPNDSSSDLSDNVSDRSYVNNTMYYDPAKSYLPWRTASTDLNARLASADFRGVSTSDTDLSGNGDLRDSQESYFYIPKAGVASPGTNSSNYEKYRIASSSASGSYAGGVVQRYSGERVLKNGSFSVSGGRWSSCIPIDVNGWSDAVVTLTGNRNTNLYLYSRSDCADWSTIRSDTSNRSSKVVNVPNGYSTVYMDVYNGNSGNYNVSYEVKAPYWVNETPTGRSQQAELQNFADWYQYHRTRNKMAKAGASEAFGKLGKNYRVGYDTIWNRGGSGGRVNGSSPNLPIAVGKDGGLFQGSNRETFYSRLQGTGALDGTPLHGALQRAARYFATDDPWKDSSGNMLVCRQNYAILTTDGYWNNKSGFIGNDIKTYSDGSSAGDGAGNVDSSAGYPYADDTAYSLADVAYYYWKNDMRTDLANSIRPNDRDPATWQHMVTFGVSIGLQGNYDPANPPPNPFPDVWLRDSYSNSGWSNSDGKQRIDDLWHASINGRGSFIVATDTEKFASALSAALASIDARNASGSNIASSSTKTESSTLTFVAGFTSVSWIGDMKASPFNAALTGVSSTPLWQLSETFKAGGVNASGFSSRTVLTSKDGRAALFNDSLPNTGVFARTTGTDVVTAADNIAYLRGDQSKEQLKGGLLRNRAYPIGDIVDSSPAYVEDNKSVFVGANDGMLHGIDARNGKVLFSYVPKGLDFASMSTLSSPAYEHRYFVDGQIDVISREKQGSGKNILVGTLGRGGRGVFALDVTNPASMNVSNVLWDETFQTSTTDPDPDMGYVFGPVRIRNGNQGKTYALVPNGVDSPNGSATLYAYELTASGTVLKKHKLVAATGSNNGLMSTGMADLNGDGKVDVVYGGDLKGNIWRWDFTGLNPGAAVKVFQATDGGGNPQPITGGLGVGRDTLGRLFVGFGTGRFISSDDVPGTGAPQQVQSLYGIIDSGVTIPGRSSLQARTIPFSGKTAKGEDARGFENYSVLQSAKQGWYIDLPVPERVTSAPTIYGSAMYLASQIPATGADCSGATGSGFVNALNLFTGTSPKSGGYFTDQTGLTGKDGSTGVIGSVGVSGGMPTEVNLTSALATWGTGGGLDTGSGGIPTPTGGQPSRISWREIIPE